MINNLIMTTTPKQKSIQKQMKSRLAQLKKHYNYRKGASNKVTWQRIFAQAARDCRKN